jgi:hypothetical protein
VWTHTLRKSFNKALNASQGLDDDTKESLMGHKLKGSRENYFDRHDIVEIRDKYAKVPLSRESTGELVELKIDVEKTKTENMRLQSKLALMIAENTQDKQEKELDKKKQEKRDKEFEDMKKEMKDYKLLTESLMRDYGRVVESVAKKAQRRTR